LSANSIAGPDGALKPTAGIFWFATFIVGMVNVAVPMSDTKTVAVYRAREKFPVLDL